MHLLYSSTCFEHCCALLQEDNCINTASGIVTLFGWLFSTQVTSGLPRGSLGGFKSPWNSEGPPKIVPNLTRLWKLIKIAEFRTPTPQDVWKKVSKILKLPPVRNCFTLAMTNKLVVIINSLKVPKMKEILLYEMKFPVPNYSCLQNHWLGGYRPPDPRSLCPQLNLLNLLPTKFLGTPLHVTRFLS